MVDFEAVESMDGTFIINRYDFNHVWEGKSKTTAKERHKQLREITDEDVNQGMQRMDKKMSKESARAGVHNAEAGRKALAKKDGKGEASHELADYRN